MNRRLFGAFGVLTVIALSFGSCKSDPLSDLDGNPAAVVTNFSLLRVAVGDTVSVTASVIDGRSTPLAVPITFTTCSAVATAVVDPEYHPVPATSARALVIAESFGTTCLIAAGGGVEDTVQVMTFPATFTLTGGPANDTIVSGTTAQFGWEFRDIEGNLMTGVTPPTFTTSDTTRAKALATPVGAVLGKSPGAVTVSALGVAVSPAGITATRTLTVVPGTFTGGITPASGDPGDTIRLTNPVGGPGFDADTRVLVNNVRAFTFGISTDTLRFIVPGVGVAGSVSLTLTDMGPNQASQGGTFTSNTASLADPYDGTNDAAATAPIITANGDYYVIMRGPCTNGVGAGDCDDYFRVTNTGGAEVTIGVEISWFTGADIDAYGLDPTLDFCTYDGGCPAATGSNPELFSMPIPAGETWVVYLNLWAPGTAASTAARVRVTGLP